jgi:membrane protein implicated in regulation of membrane protease activity
MGAFMDLLFWWWVVLAAVLVIAEIFTTGFYLLPFGVGAVVAAVLKYLDVAVAWQIGAFLVVAVLLLVSLRRFADQLTHEPPEKVGAARLVGRTAMVIEDIDTHGNLGRVRIQKEEWRADSSTGEPIEFGTSVIIDRVDGAHLVVHPEVTKPATREEPNNG